MYRVIFSGLLAVISAAAFPAGAAKYTEYCRETAVRAFSNNELVRHDIEDSIRNFREKGYLAVEKDGAPRWLRLHAGFAEGTTSEKFYIVQDLILDDGTTVETLAIGALVTTAVYQTPGSKCRVADFERVSFRGKPNAVDLELIKRENP
jgi:hypothetical protein